MRIAVFSDVHGNKYAMSSFLAKLQSVDYDKAVFLLLSVGSAGDDAHNPLAGDASRQP